MGRIVKQLGSDTVRYYWYPGDRKDYLRAAAAVFLGILAYVVLHAVTGTTLLPAVAGTSLTALIAGFNFGRRDARASAALAEAADATRGRGSVKALRRKAAAHSGRAAWRGFVEGTGGAVAAVAIVNLSASGVVANWFLPLVPAVVGALAHQAGMAVESLRQPRTPDLPAHADFAGIFDDDQKPGTPRLPEARSRTSRTTPPRV